MTSNPASLTQQIYNFWCFSFSMFLSDIIVLLPEGLSLKFVVMLVCVHNELFALLQSRKPLKKVSRGNCRVNLISLSGIAVQGCQIIQCLENAFVFLFLYLLTLFLISWPHSFTWTFFLFAVSRAILLLRCMGLSMQ